MFFSAMPGPAQRVQEPAQLAQRPSASEGSFWTRRQVKKAIDIGVVALVAVVAAALLFSPGAPLVFAGLVLAGVIASKLGVGLLAAKVISGLGIVILPPALALAIFGISKTTEAPKAPEIETIDGNLKIDGVQYSMLKVYDKPGIAIKEKGEWITDSLRGHCPLFIDHDVFLAPRNAQRQDINYQKVVNEVIEKINDMPDLSKGCVQSVTNFSQNEIIASVLPDINLENPPIDRTPIMQSRTSEEAQSQIVIQSEPLRTIQMRKIKVVEWDTSSGEIVEKLVANIDVAYVYDPKNDQLAVYIHKL